MGSILSQNVKRKLVYPHRSSGTIHTEDFQPSMEGGFNGLDSSSDDIIVTMKDVASNWDGSSVIVWFFKKMKADNRVLFALETESDNMLSGVDSIVLEKQNSGVEVILNANGKYTFSKWDGLTTAESSPVVVSTLTPSLTDTTLHLNGSLDDIGVNSSVDVNFRYRDITSGGVWVTTTAETVSATGLFADEVSVTAGNTYEVQALATSGSVTYYGAVLQTSVNYYSDLDEALNDGLVWGSQIQEGSGLVSADVFGNYDITWDGVTWGSETINSQTINKVVFGADDFGQSDFAPAFSSQSYTILVQMRNDSSSGDHTMLNFGRNCLSIASDGSGIQLEVNNNIETWSSATPTSTVKSFFITVDRNANVTKLEEVTDSAVTVRCTTDDLPSVDASYTRIGKGSSGDANHQDYETLDNGDGMSIFVWQGIKPDNTKMDIVSLLSVDGGQVV